FGLTCVQISRMKQETHLRWNEPETFSWGLQSQQRIGRAGTLTMHRQRLTHRCVGNAGSSLAVIWFQLGSNEGPLNRRFFGISGADSTVLRFVNSRKDRKSKCPIWCRLREIESHFSFFSCTHASSSESGSLCGNHADFAGRTIQFETNSPGA